MITVEYDHAVNEALCAIDDAKDTSILTGADYRYLTTALTKPTVELIDVLDFLATYSYFATTERFKTASSLRTKYGTTIQQMAAHSGKNDSYFSCCHDAEPNLLASLGIYPSHLPRALSGMAEGRLGTECGPLICICDEGELVAVQKNVGETSIYALTSRPDLGLVQGAFSGSSIHFSPHRIDTDLPVVAADVRAYRSFYPIRASLSVFEHAAGAPYYSTWEGDPFSDEAERELGAYLLAAFQHEAIVDAAMLAHERARRDHSEIK